MDDERDEKREREDDEAFLDVWREWRQGQSSEEAEAMIARMLANRSPACVGVARPDLEREARGKN